MIGFIGISLQLQLIITAHTLNSLSDESLINLSLISTLLNSWNALPFITAWESNRDHRLQGFHSVSRIHCLGNHVLIRGNTLIPPSMFVAAKCVLTVRCLAMDYFVKILTCPYRIMLWELESSGRFCCLMYWTLVLLTRIGCSLHCHEPVW
jgi:hypothetical protein